MGFFESLKRLFIPKEPEDRVELTPVAGMDDENPFVFSQHLRIIIAIFFSMISAVILWWILE